MLADTGHMILSGEQDQTARDDLLSILYQPVMFEFLWMNAFLSYMSIFFKKKRKRGTKPGVSGCLGLMKNPEIKFTQATEAYFLLYQGVQWSGSPGAVGQESASESAGLWCLSTLPSSCWLLGAGTPFLECPQETLPPVLLARKFPCCYLSTPTPVTNKRDKRLVWASQDHSLGLAWALLPSPSWSPRKVQMAGEGGAILAKNEEEGKIKIKTQISEMWNLKWLTLHR